MREDFDKVLEKDLIELSNNPQFVIKKFVYQSNGYIGGSLVNVEQTYISEAFTKKVDSPLPNVECAICLDTFHTGEFKTNMKCHHSFHYKCIIEWGERSDFCSLCRHSFRINVWDFVV